MKKAYGLIELLLGFLILCVLITMGLHMSVNQLKNYKDGQAIDPIGTEVQQVIEQVEKAKEINRQQEQSAIDNWLE